MDRTTVERIDDIDQRSNADERVRFALDGKRYMIDLTAEHAAGLRKALQPYITAGRKDDAAGSPAASRRSRRSPNADRNSAIRAWAAAEGIKVSQRGQPPASVVARYDAAHSAPARSASQPPVPAPARSAAQASVPAPAGNG